MEEKKSVFHKIKEKITIKRIVAVAVLVAVMLVTARFFMPAGGDKMPAFQTTGTRTTVLHRQVLNDSVTVTGTVESTQTVNVTCTLTGYTVSEILVQAGDNVTQGDVIARLDTTDLLENIAKTKEKLASNVETAQLNYNQAESDKNKAYDACIAQETVLNSATDARNTALKNFEIAKMAVAAQQSAYDDAAARAQTANNRNNQYIAILNDKKAELDSAAAAAGTAQAALESAQTAYDNALAENSSETDSLKTVLDAAQADYDSALAAHTAADSRYQSAYATVYDLSIGTQADYDRALTVQQSAQQALNDAKAQTNYTALENEYNNAERTRQSARTTLDNLQKAYTNALTSFEKAKENLENASTSDELEQLYEKYNNCTITANASGTITQVNTQVGSVANGTVAVIQDTENLKISTSFREYDVQNIEIGMQCIITSDANDKQLSGYVSQISPVAAGGNMGSSDVSFPAEVTINGNDHGLLIGMNAQAEIIITQVSDAFVVPYDAVGTDENGEKVVYVQNGEDFTPVVVTTGMETDYYIEITSNQLKDGMVIRSSADENASDTVVFDEDGETAEEGGFDFGMMGGMTGGNMPDRGNMPSGGNRPSGGMPSGDMPGGRG